MVFRRPHTANAQPAYYIIKQCYSKVQNDHILSDNVFAMKGEQTFHQFI